MLPPRPGEFCVLSGDGWALHRECFIEGDEGEDEELWTVTWKLTGKYSLRMCFTGAWVRKSQKWDFVSLDICRKPDVLVIENLSVQGVCVTVRPLSLHVYACDSCMATEFQHDIPAELGAALMGCV
jgi:hypothetical protein